MARATVHTWSELTADAPMGKSQRRRIVGDQMMLSHLYLHKGFKLDIHSHTNEQFCVVLSGRMRFILEPGAKAVELTAGQVLQIPGGVGHGAEALEDSEVLDIFSPVSETTGIDSRR